MALSSEDQLKINVMLANPFDALRIDEQNLTLHSLSGDKQASIRLNPNCRSEQYLKYVRELISGHVLGSPSGYPVFIQRWTRMGQTRADNLVHLLKLGEPEAVVAVAGAKGLTNELARHTWWASPTADTARCMLERQCVIEGDMGKTLAEYLLEHLPFETDTLAIINTVRLVLQPGLIDKTQTQKLWNKGEQIRAYLVGFLAAKPHDLPEPVPARLELKLYRKKLTKLAAQNNSLASLLLQIMSISGQTYLQVADAVLRKPVNQDDTVALLNTIARYFKAANTFQESREQDIDIIMADARKTLKDASNTDLKELVKSTPELGQEIQAMLVLARCNEAIITPILAHSTAVGTVLQKQLQPTTDKVFATMNILRGNV